MASTLREIVTTAIVEAVRSEIEARKGITILDSAESYQIAVARAEEMVTPDVGGFGTKTMVSLSVRDAYSSTREMVASQLVGLTMQRVISVVTEAKARFQGEAKLDIVARPTLAYTGECEPHDIWNLLSNAITARRSAENDDGRAWNSEDRKLFEELKKTQQMLHFLSQGEVLEKDIDDNGFDGRLRSATAV